MQETSGTPPRASYRCGIASHSIYTCSPRRGNTLCRGNSTVGPRAPPRKCNCRNRQTRQWRAVEIQSSTRAHTHPERRLKGETETRGDYMRDHTSQTSLGTREPTRAVHVFVLHRLSSQGVQVFFSLAQPSSSSSSSTIY